MGRERTIQDYMKLEDNQLSTWNICLQWLVVRILWCIIHFKYRMRVKGLENRPKGWQSYVIASNHSSTLDPPIISVSLDYQPISYMAKIELFKSRAWAEFYYQMAGIAVDRDKVEKATIKSAIKVLKTGRWAMCLFPEGTRNAYSTLGETKKGVAFIAKAAGAPVLPIGIHRCGKNFKDIFVRIGELIPPEDDLDAFNQKIFDAITRLIEEAKADEQAEKAR